MRLNLRKLFFSLVSISTGTDELSNNAGSWYRSYQEDIEARQLVNGKCHSAEEN